MFLPVLAICCCQNYRSHKNMMKTFIDFLRRDFVSLQYRKTGIKYFLHLFFRFVSACIHSKKNKFIYSHCRLVHLFMQPFCTIMSVTFFLNIQLITKQIKLQRIESECCYYFVIAYFRFEFRIWFDYFNKITDVQIRRRCLAFANCSSVIRIQHIILFGASPCIKNLVLKCGNRTESG